MNFFSDDASLLTEIKDLIMIEKNKNNCIIEFGLEIAKWKQVGKRFAAIKVKWYKVGKSLKNKIRLR